MKLLFDLIALQPSQGKFHGGGEYAKTLLYRIIAKKTKRDELSACYLKTKWIDETILRDCEKAGITLHQLTAVNDIERLIAGGSFDTFYSALPYTYGGIDTGSTTFSMTIHGLRDLEMPTDMFESRYTGRISKKVKSFIKRALPGLYRAHISASLEKLFARGRCELFVPSEHTRYAIATLLGVPPEVMHVCYSPRKIEVPARIHAKDSAIQPLLGKMRNYILIVGGDRWIKNSYRALTAIDRYIGDRHNVIVVGGDRICKTFRHNKSIHPIGYVESETLEYLYKNARILLYPTLNEGFGYPPLEAMKYGTPVVASAITSLTEIYGDDILYVNPYSIEEIATRVYAIMHDDVLREKYAVKARKRYRAVTAVQSKSVDRIASILLGR